MDIKLFEEEKIYSSNISLLSEADYNVIRTAIRNNHATGFIAGYYDEQLTITNVSEFFLHNLTYTYDKFMQITAGSLKNLIWDEEHTLTVESFKQIQGEYTAQILARNNKPMTVHLLKLDSIDKTGKPMWVMSTNVDLRQQQLQLTNQELSAQNEAMTQLIRSALKLVDRYALCDLEQDTYTYYSCLPEDDAYPASGSYHDLVARVIEKYKIINKNISLAQALDPACIREKLTTPDDMYKIEYCTKNEKQFKTIAITPLTWINNHVGKIMLIAQDTTQEKLTEIAARKALEEAYIAANKANEAKTAFLSNMSHDIRTPMNAIVGMTAIAGANIDNKEKVLDCLGKITQSSRHLLSLINEVLDMSRIESGKISLNEEEFNLSALADNLISMANPSIEMHGHQFEVHLQKITHENVCGDSLRIQQLLTNILSNAIKYTPDGGKIFFSIAELPITEKGMGCYEFVIEDNGIGMSEEFQKIMFDPFTRADDSTTNKVFGTGLGMAIAKNIVNMMNGTIKVESAPGSGSKFTITLFLKVQAEPAAERISELSGLPVLVVDDDEICCESTVNILHEIGMSGEFVTSGKEAVQRAIEHHKNNDDYFAIIVDWQMPGMDGLETTKKIRKYLGNDVTIIVLTAYDYTDIEEEAKEAGVNEFMSKPLFRSRLCTTLKSTIEGKPSKATSSLSSITQVDYKGKHILLVEDNKLNREIATEIISMTGAEVIPAVNGKEAVEKFAAAPAGFFDLVFMDIQMPIMNGYTATAAIRSLDRSDAKTLPIIAMTANAFTEDVLMAKNAGMNEHMAKPLDINKLNETLKRWL